MNNSIMRKIASLFAVVSLLNLLISPARAVNNLQAWLPCSINPSPPCIEGISAQGANGKKIQGSLTGRKRIVNDGFAGNIVVGESYEWRIPGITHQNGEENVLLKAFYFPRGTPYCYGQLENTCDYSVDQSVVNLTPSFLDGTAPPVHFPNLPSDKVCGDAENPILCTPGWNLNPDFSYNFEILLPKDFTVSLAHLYAKSGSLTYTNLPNGEVRMNLSAIPATQAVIFRPTINQNDRVKADYVANFLDFYLESTQSGQVEQFNSCGAQGMSIWHNGDLISFPSWSEEDQSLEISVTGAHEYPDGSQNIGTFEVQMPINLAKCLWNVDLSKKVNVSLTATYPELNKVEVVTSIGKVIDGNYYLFTSGFHYSDTKIALRMTQIPIPTISTSKSNASKSVLSCKKGSKVIAIKTSTVKCPKGYSRVS
jgi:hypothetical protein